jgi:hypothetical protein
VCSINVKNNNKNQNIQPHSGWNLPTSKGSAIISILIDLCSRTGNRYTVTEKLGILRKRLTGNVRRPHLCIPEYVHLPLRHIAFLCMTDRRLPCTVLYTNRSTPPFCSIEIALTCNFMGLLLLSTRYKGYSR